MAKSPLSISVSHGAGKSIRSVPDPKRTLKDDEVAPQGVLLTACKIVASKNNVLPNDETLSNILRKAGGYHFTLIARTARTVTFGMSRVASPQDVLRRMAANVHRHLAKAA